MTVSIPVSLNQVYTDLGNPPEKNLSSANHRARINGSITGSMSLAAMGNTTTAMCAVIGGYTDLPRYPYKGTPETNGMTHDHHVKGVSGYDITEAVEVMCAGKYSETDATCELIYPGYVTPGTYRLKGTASRGSSVAPWSISIVINTNNFLSGSQMVLYNLTSYGSKAINDAFVVPAGYPYLTCIVYQFVYLHPSHGGTANYYTPYYSTFADMRVKKE